MYQKPITFILAVSEPSMEMPGKIHLMVFMEVRMKKWLRRKYVSFSQKVSKRYNPEHIRWLV